MATKIRLKRFGKKRAPFYRVVVVDSRKARNGRPIEEIGLYHPMRQPSLIEIDSERALYWLGVGAQPSDTVRALLELTGDLPKHRGEDGKNTVKPQVAKLSPDEKIQKAADDAEKMRQAKAKAAEEAKRVAEEEEKAKIAEAAAEAAAATQEAEGSTEDAPAAPESTDEPEAAVEEVAQEESADKEAN
ncbi:MAG: 30S ribosomal protein S16 [Candidatus Ancillula sp.]|jgi:small subunit ribosomal protein S16|nr:30S ribosomal protein S16 [Candidatus Ancillula sp.]